MPLIFSTFLPLTTSLLLFIDQLYLELSNILPVLSKKAISDSFFEISSSLLKYIVNVPSS